MIHKKIKISKLNKKAKLPSYGSEYAAGADLYACIEEEVFIKPKETAFIKTGISIEVPNGYAGLIYARSGLSTKNGLAPANKVGVIDSDYRGEIIVALHNHSTLPATVCPDERIAQIVITPVLRAEFVEQDFLSETERQDKGFGSTGR